MNEVESTAFEAEVGDRRPSSGRFSKDWPLVVTFWVFSLFFGIVAATSGWGITMLVAWVMLASTFALMRRDDGGGPSVRGHGAPA